MVKPTPKLVTVDIVAEIGRRIPLIIRKNEPFRGALALPGGFIDPGESAEEAAIRELHEEVGLKANKKKLRLIGVYSDPNRDPRGEVISIAFFVKVAASQKIVAADDAAAAYLVSSYKDEDMAFDHGKIIGDAMRLIYGDRGFQSPIRKLSNKCALMGGRGRRSQNAGGGEDLGIRPNGHAAGAEGSGFQSANGSKGIGRVE